jgi:hypothetical protein
MLIVYKVNVHEEHPFINNSVLQNVSIFILNIAKTCRFRIRKRTPTRTFTFENFVSIILYNPLRDYFYDNRLAMPCLFKNAT